MRRPEEQEVRVTRPSERSCGAGLCGRIGTVARVAIGAALAVAVLVSFRQMRFERESAARQARLAQAAALDRRSRDDQLRVWGTVLQTDPGSALALAHLAGLNVQKARETGSESYYPIAEAMARRSLELRTHRNAKTFVVLASSLLAQHRFAEARTAAASAVELEPETAQYRALLAEIDMELGDYDAAARGFAGLGRYRAHLSIGPRLARWDEVNGRVALARETLQELVGEAARRRELPREQLAWFHFRLGDHYRRHGSPRRARAAYDAALAVNPGDYRAQKGLAELELAHDRAGRALPYARAAVRQSRTPETLLTLARALRETLDTMAAEAVDAEVETAIGDEGGSFERAWHAYRLDRGMPAVELIELVELLKREAGERGDVRGHDLLAWAYHKSGRSSEARAASAKALRSHTSDAVVWYHAGIISHSAGDIPRARAYLREALRLNPRFHQRQARHARSVLRSMEKANTQPAAG